MGHPHFAPWMVISAKNAQIGACGQSSIARKNWLDAKNQLFCNRFSASSKDLGSKAPYLPGLLQTSPPMIHHITLQYAKKKSKKKGRTTVVFRHKKNWSQEWMWNWEKKLWHWSPQLWKTGTELSHRSGGWWWRAPIHGIRGSFEQKKKPKMAAFYKKLPKKMGDQPENNWIFATSFSPTKATKSKPLQSNG